MIPARTMSVLGVTVGRSTLSRRPGAWIGSTRCPDTLFSRTYRNRATSNPVSRRILLALKGPDLRGRPSPARGPGPASSKRAGGDFPGRRRSRCRDLRLERRPGLRGLCWHRSPVEES